MAGNRTFTIIKPNAVVQSHIGEICAMIEAADFRIVAVKMLHLSSSDIERFYHAHLDKPFFKSLHQFMTSGAVVVMVLERENAVEELRRLVGATDPKLAAEGSIRRLFAQSTTQNAIHASDSDESALWERRFFFSLREEI
ncbi:MAG: nucleoside-diphosphate kinase [Rikenellaceae bacterium]